MTLLPPLTGTPLDYVPIDAPQDGYVPDHDVDRKGQKRGSPQYRPWNDPDHWFSFTAPVMRRAVVAGLVAAGFVSVFFFPSIGIGAIALSVMYGFVWAGNKLGDRLNEREAARPKTTTPASWWPDPFSWVPAILALVFIAAVIYFH